MTDRLYIIFDRSGIVRTCKTSRFELRAGEYVTELILDVPDALFQPVRVPTIHIELDPSAVRRPVVALPYRVEDAGGENQ